MLEIFELKYEKSILENLTNVAEGHKVRLEHQEINKLLHNKI